MMRSNLKLIIVQMPDFYSGICLLLFLCFPELLMASVVRGLALLKAGGEGLRFTHVCFTEKSSTLHKYSVWNQDGFGCGTRMVWI
jgi:hypothetical protein